LRVNLVLVRASIVGLFLALVPAVASADWLYVPFVGAAFGGSTALLDLEQGASSTQLIFGGSAGWWSSGIIGFETDFAYAPRFFETDNLAGLVTHSNLITWGGTVVVAVPVSVTRESLRPYVVAGLGWMHTSIDEGSNLFPEFVGRGNSIGLNFGGGAVGFISPRTGLRFEVRHFQSLEYDEHPVTLESTSLLSFWRATVGVVIRR
jgi:hypothetical protein